MAGAKSSPVLSYSQNFIDGCQALHHFGKSVLAQSDQSAFTAQLSELSHVRISRAHVAQVVVHDQQFVDAQTPGVSGLSAAVASFAFVRFLGCKALQLKEF